MLRQCSLTIRQRKYQKSLYFYSWFGGLENVRKNSGLSYKHHIGSTPLKHITLGTVLNEAANEWPDRPAIISRHENKTLTYSQLLEEADKLAASFRGIGLERGDRLGIWLPNCTQWIVAMMAAAKAGLISVAINYLYGKSEIKYALEKVEVKAVLAAGSLMNNYHSKILNEIIPELSSSVPGDLNSTSLKNLKVVILVSDDNKSQGTISYDKLLDANTKVEVSGINKDMHFINPDAACNIQYTSGTTGSPKAAILSHNNIVNNGFVIGSRNKLSAGYKKICVQVPLFHVYGVVVTISSALQHGATIVLPSAKYSSRANLEALLAEKCEVIHGTPTMYVDLVNAVRSQGVTGLRSQLAITGGAPVTPKLVQDMADVLKVSDIKSIFGMTETTAVNFQSLSDEDPQRPLHYLGHLHDHLEAKVVNDQDDIVPLGQPGELLIRGYSTMIGYWNDDKKTKEMIGEDRWLRTGDQVVLHEDGYSQIMGRLKDIIIRGGENISPKEIEDVMSIHPDILECQLFGVQDDRLGEEVCAAVRLREGVQFNPEMLSKHVAQHLAKYKVPRIVKKVENFPKTASGKVQKFKLRNMVESGQL